MTTVSASVTATTATAPGWRTTSRSKDIPSGSRKVALVREMIHPRWRTSSSTISNRGRSLTCPGWPASAVGIDDGEAGIPTLGPVQGRFHQLAEERVGLIGTTLEFGVGLGPDPEGVTGELDELDQTAVGRDARAHQADVFEAGAVAGVDLVAVPMAL